MYKLKLQVKHLLLALLAVTVVGGIGYKYYEWNMLNSLSRYYNESVIEELGATELLTELYNEYGELAEVSETSAEISPESQESAEERFDKAVSKIKLIVDQQEQYLDMAKNNRKVLQQLTSQPNLLLGDKRNFFTQVSTLQLEYYDRDIDRVEKELIVLHFMENFFGVTQESSALTEFEEVTQGNPALYPDNMSIIIAFKKYRDESYKFPHQDEIKKYYPKLYKVLENLKSFYGLYYDIAEDLAKGDQESAAYKAAKLQEAALSLAVDPDDLVKDEIEKGKEASKKSIASIVKQIRLIKDFERTNNTKFPLLPELSGYEEDLVLCVIYTYKTETVYYDLMNEYPKAKNAEELLNELKTISPRTDEVDKQFSKNTLQLTNDDKKMSFICNGSERNNTFIFDVIKK